MKTLKEALFSRRNIKSNPYGLTKDDLKGKIEGFPLGVVVRMWEEAKKQDNRYKIEVFLTDGKANCDGLFLWDNTEAGLDFWARVIKNKDFELFFNKYPEYERFNLS